MNKIKFCFNSVKFLAKAAKTSIGIGWKLSLTAFNISNSLVTKSFEAVNVVNNIFLIKKYEPISKKSNFRILLLVYLIILKKKRKEKSKLWIISLN